MLSSAVIVFREVLEAALIVSILLAATRGMATRTRWISTGVIAGIIGAASVVVVGIGRPAARVILAEAAF